MGVADNAKQRELYALIEASAASPEFYYELLYLISSVNLPTTARHTAGNIHLAPSFTPLTVRLLQPLY